MTTLPISSIIIRRDDRQRRDPDPSHIEDLAMSISQIGLINPITISESNELIAGECRLLAHLHLGLSEIEVRYFDELDEVERFRVELEENIKRQSLPWQDEVEAIARYHQLMKEADENHSHEETGTQLNMSREKVSQVLRVKAAMDEGVQEVINAPQFSTARSFTERRAERRKHSSTRDLLSMGGMGEEVEDQSVGVSAEAGQVSLSSVYGESKDAGTDDVQNQAVTAEIINIDFLEWSKTIQPLPFNLIHCDFPYGVNTGDKIGQSAAKGFGGYDDSPDIYWELLRAFLSNQDNFIARSAHMIFWFSMKFYRETVDDLREAGWRVDDFPLIWHRGNSGILPDPNRGPRRTYETALFCTRGDRKIVKAVGNSVEAKATKEFHMSEKPKPVLDHFFRMLVDDTSRVLDPTCGSGNSIVCGREAGAQYSLGLELNPDFAERAKENLDG